MHTRLLDILCCPACGGGLRAEPFEWAEAQRISNGILLCPCGLWFPIIDGVPRLLLHHLRRQLAERHPGFYRTFANRLPAAGQAGTTGTSATILKTQASFGYEWTEFADYGVDNFSEFIKPLEQGAFHQTFGLDVGCGAGRHAKHATSLGAEVVGMDLSHAVDSAVRNNKDNPSTHFVQADVLNLPFRPHVFDFIYSLGVLHHLPDPERGFQRLIPSLKPGGSMFIWVYQRTTRKQWLEQARRITTRMPFLLVKGLAWAATVIDYGLAVNLYRVLKSIPAVERHAPLRIKEYAQYDFHSSYTDWFDRLSAPVSHFYSEHEIHGWFQRAGLNKIETALVGDSWVWARGWRGT